VLRKNLRANHPLAD